MCHPLTSCDFSCSCCFLPGVGAMESQLAPAALDRGRLSLRRGQPGWGLPVWLLIQQAAESYGSSSATAVLPSELPREGRMGREQLMS